MLQRLHLRNLTVFSDADFHFSGGLNLIVGENGTGKTHALKAAYTAIHVCASGARDSGSSEPTKTHLQKALADKLQRVFMPDRLGRLARRQAGRNRCEICCEIEGIAPLGLSFNTTSKEKVTIDRLPDGWLDKLPVYLPTRELLTIAPGFPSLYETAHVPFEETYYDTCLMLSAPLARGPRERQIRQLLEPIEDAMGGKVESDQTGRFYLKESTGGKLEMHLVAEGLRKLAMLARLIATGQLVEKGYLFWDEPEANLNPKIVKTLAKTILELCKAGIQMFVATHSLFLMRELDILLQTPEFTTTERRFFGLRFDDDAVEVLQGDSVDDIGDITSLDEELEQSDRFLSTEATS